MKLIFVYNAKAGRINALLDSAHKILQPHSYPCKLCELTFGTLKEKAAWKTFRESNIAEMVFLHKDEFARQYKSKWLPKYEFPLVLIVHNNELQPFILSEALETMSDTNHLIKRIEEKITQY